MKDNEEKQKFIELRASGLSFDKISKELDTSKVTLMKWEKEFTREIGELRYLEFEALRDKFLMNKKARLLNYGELLDKARKELTKRDFNEISAEKLVSIVSELERKFKDELQSVKCDSEEKEILSGIDWGLKDSPKYTWILDD